MQQIHVIEMPTLTSESISLFVFMYLFCMYVCVISRSLIKTFYTASHLLSCLKQFGELDDEVSSALAADVRNLVQHQTEDYHYSLQCTNSLCDFII